MPVNRLLRARLFSFRLGLYQFSPGIFTSIVTAALLYTMLSLGFWQLDRAEYRRDLQQKIENRKDLEPIEFHLLPSAAEQYRYLPVFLRGRFDDVHQFLHDNRIVNGVSGFHVYTPFHADTGQTLLVNRGWIPQERTRDMVPNISVGTDIVRIEGLADVVPPRGVILADNVHADVRWPMILQYLDAGELSPLVGTDLQPMIVWLSPDSSQVYHHEYPAVNLNSAKNTGYAVQWFALSLALTIIYFITNTRRVPPDVRT